MAINNFTDGQSTENQQDIDVMNSQVLLTVDRSVAMKQPCLYLYEA